MSPTKCFAVKDLLSSEPHILWKRLSLRIFHRLGVKTVSMNNPIRREKVRFGLSPLLAPMGGLYTYFFADVLRNLQLISEGTESVGGPLHLKKTLNGATNWKSDHVKGIVAGCNSLILVDGTNIGYPLPDSAKSHLTQNKPQK